MDRRWKDPAGRSQGRRFDDLIFDGMDSAHKWRADDFFFFVPEGFVDNRSGLGERKLVYLFNFATDVRRHTLPAGESNYDTGSMLFEKTLEMKR